MAWAKAYLRIKLQLDPSSRLATTYMVENYGGGLCPFRGEKLDPHLTQFGEGRGYFHAKFHLDPSSRLATINMGRKLGALRPLIGEGERGLHLTQCRLGRGLPPYQVAS